MAPAVGVQHGTRTVLRPTCPAGCPRCGSKATRGCPQDERGQGADHLLLQALQAHKAQRRAHPQPASARPRKVDAVLQVQRHGRDRRAGQRPEAGPLAGSREHHAAVAGGCGDERPGRGGGYGAGRGCPCLLRADHRRADHRVQSPDRSGQPRQPCPAPRLAPQPGRRVAGADKRGCGQGSGWQPAQRRAQGAGAPAAAGQDQQHQV